MNTQPYPQSYVQDDEIDLFELAEKLWAKKVLLVAITLLATVLSVAVALLLPPTWKSEARILPANTAGLSDYNAIAIELSQSELATSKLEQGQGQMIVQSPLLTPQEAIDTFYRNLSSRSTLQLVFQGKRPERAGGSSHTRRAKKTGHSHGI